MTGAEAKPVRVEPEGLEPFEVAASIDLEEACERILRGRDGRTPLSIQSAQRFANPRIGYPVPRSPYLLVLPTVLWSGKRRLMPSWAVWFEGKRAELGRQT